ncbi:MAG: glycosyltransferase family 39 protein [Bacteroidota bacterium]
MCKLLPSQLFHLLTTTRKARIFSLPISTNTWLLGLILAVALFLRLYRIESLSLGNDDLSALHRLNFPTFGELIEKGVKPDGHPAGVQVFLYLWTSLFGNSPWVLRLPFMLCSLLAIVGGYKLGKLWFSTTTGLLVASCLACWEYPLMHSLSIRPYILGMFSSIGFVYCWSFVTGFKQPYSQKYLWGFIVFGTACAYIHYFSLLLVGLVGLTGIIISRKKELLGGLLGIIVLYLPHIPIFWAQIQIGGIGGWLAAPQSDFLLGYFRFLLHFSFLQYLLLFFFLLSGIFLAKRYAYLPQWQPFTFSLSWFLSTFLIGYTYSIWVNPVLHFGVLFFVFPFLLLALFSLFPEVSVLLKSALVLTLLFLSTYTLIEVREHYDIFYNRGAQQISHTFSEWRLERGNDNLTTIGIAYHRDYIDYYLDQEENSEDLSLYALPPLNTFERWLEQQHTSYLAFGWLNKRPPLAYLGLMQKYFPYRVESHKKAISEWFLFSRNPKDSLSQYSPNYFDTNSPILQQTSNKEFGPTLEIPFPGPIQTPYDWVKIQGTIRNLDRDRISQWPQIVCSIEKEGKVYQWRNISFKEFEATSFSSLSAFLYLRLRDLPVPNTENLTLKTYIWNPGKITLEILDFQLGLEPGNAELYAIIAPVEK